ncbi:hypothetical protein B0H11DRAFT_2269253 [Mycena galericulata]|nr:hypothetical protein B0H11DRAFT_2269253 [Mycena galericulata]
MTHVRPTHALSILQSPSMLEIFRVLIVVIISPTAAILLMALPMALTLGIIMPYIGVLVRYRANYSPKRLRGLTVAEGEIELEDTDSHISYFGMMQRVYRVEGWAGLYKGIIPSIIGSIISAVLLSPTLFLLPIPVFFWLGPWVILNGQRRAPGLALPVPILALLITPVQIIINRTITTPYKLATFSPSAALRVLLSAKERAQPLRLYFAPGVALAQVLESLVGAAMMLLPQLISRRIGFSVPHRLPALAVMAARLTLQRLGDAPAVSDPDTDADAPAVSDQDTDTGAPAGLDQNTDTDAPAVSDQDADTEAPPVYEKAVIDFRTQETPYTGLLACGIQIVREEDWRALFRAWWLTALVILLPMLVLFITPTDW